jgi:hypothetical protein
MRACSGCGTDSEHCQAEESGKLEVTCGALAMLGALELVYLDPSE